MIHFNPELVAHIGPEIAAQFNRNLQSILFRFTLSSSCLIFNEINNFSNIPISKAIYT